MDINKLFNVVKTIGNSESNFVSYLKNNLANAIKNADKKTQETFFYTDKSNSFPSGFASGFAQELKVFSKEYICYAISNCTTRNINITIRESSANSQVKEWLSNNSNSIGTALMINFVKEKAEECFSDINECIRLISEKMLDDSYFLPFMIETTEGQQGGLPGNFLLLMLKSLDTSDMFFTTTYKKLISNETYKKHLINYDSLDWFGAIKGFFNYGGSVFDNIKDCVSNAAESYRIEDATSPYDETGFYRHYVYFYAEKLLDWVKAYAPSCGLFTGVTPKITESKTEGCVVKGTKIIMADGSEKLIEDINPGDEVFSVGGNISICSKELVVNEKVSYLYSINDDVPFMSPDHPILTQTGWRCLTPLYAREMNPSHEINTLQIGDVINKGFVTEDGKIEYKNVKVTKINIVPNNEVCYDLHFDDGFKSYHANNYCCFLNYPNITPSFVAESILKRTSSINNNGVLQELEEATPALSKIFPKSAVDYTKKIIKNRKNYNKSDIEKSIEFQLNNKAFILMDVWGKNCAIPDGLESLSIINNYLIWGKSYSPVKITIKGKNIFFQRTDKNGIIESGILTPVYNGLMLQGVLTKGNEKYEFFAAKKSVYNLYRWKEDSSEKERWLDLHLGFEYDAISGVNKAKAYLILPDEPINDESRIDRIVSINSIYDKNLKTTLLKLIIDMIDMDFDDYIIKAELTFDPYYTSVSGKGITKENADKKAVEYRIDGKFNRMEEITALINSFSDYLMNKESLAYNLYAGFANQEKIAFCDLSTLKSKKELSLEELLHLPQPEKMEYVHDRSFGIMRNLMLYGISDYERSFFAQKKPTVGENGDLTQAQADLLKKPKYKDFIVNKFGRGYLTYAFSKSSEPKIERFFGAESVAKIEAFWKKSNKKEYLTASNEYRELSSIFFKDAYSEFVPGLDDYSKNNPKEWAQKLYNYVSDDAIILGLAIAYEVDNGARLTHLTTLLNILDETEYDNLKGFEGKKLTFAAALYASVINVVIIESVRKINKLSDDPKEELHDFLLKYFENYIKSIINGKSLEDGQEWDKAIRERLSEELSELQKEAEIKTLDDLITQLSGTIVEFLEFMINLGSALTTDRFMEFLNKGGKIVQLLKKGTFEVIKGLFSMAYMGFACFTITLQFMNYKKLSILEKCELFTMSARIIIGFATDLSSYLAALCMLEAKSFKEMVKAKRIIDNTLSKMNCMKQITVGGKDFYTNVMEAAKTEGIVTKESTLSAKMLKFSKIASAIAKVITIVLLGFALVMCIFEIISDYSQGHLPAHFYIELFEAIILTATIAVEIIGIFASGIAATICMGIGIVLAAVGLILFFIGLFLPREEKESEVEKYVRENCVPFINELPKPDPEPKQSLVKAFFKPYINIPAPEFYAYVF